MCLLPTACCCGSDIFPSSRPCSDRTEARQTTECRPPDLSGTAAGDAVRDQ